MSPFYSELQGCYKRCTLDTIAGYLNIVATRNIYNPVIELLAETKWDGQDHIAELCDIIGIDEDDELSRTLVKKWLMQSIAMLQNNIEAPFGADGVLVLQGEQGTGKTSLFRQLAMHREFFKDGVTLNFSDKDTAIRATSCWIAELGEIESTTLKSDVERLKSFITAEVDEYRRPYARGDTRSARHTSFCGSCNNIDFLSDQTGNRRFWTVESSGKINFKQLTPEKVKQIWAQANVLLCKGGLQSFRLTDSERDALAARNSSHTVKMKGEAEIEDLLNSSGKHKMACPACSFCYLLSVCPGSPAAGGIKHLCPLQSQSPLSGPTLMWRSCFGFRLLRPPSRWALFPCCDYSILYGLIYFN